MILACKLAFTIYLFRLPGAWFDEFSTTSQADFYVGSGCGFGDGILFYPATVRVESFSGKTESARTARACYSPVFELPSVEEVIIALPSIALAIVAQDRGRSPKP